MHRYSHMRNKTKARSPWFSKPAWGSSRPRRSGGRRCCSIAFVCVESGGPRAQESLSPVPVNLAASRGRTRGPVDRVGLRSAPLCQTHELLTDSSGFARFLSFDFFSPSQRELCSFPSTSRSAGRRRESSYYQNRKSSAIDIRRDLAGFPALAGACYRVQLVGNSSWKTSCSDSSPLRPSPQRHA